MKQVQIITITGAGSLDITGNCARIVEMALPRRTAECEVIVLLKGRKIYLNGNGEGRFRSRNRFTWRTVKVRLGGQLPEGRHTYDPAAAGSPTLLVEWEPGEWVTYTYRPAGK